MHLPALVVGVPARNKRNSRGVTGCTGRSRSDLPRAKPGCVLIRFFPEVQMSDQMDTSENLALNIGS